MRKLLIVAALLLLPRAADADPAPWVWASTCAIDWGTTYYGVTAHGPEGLVNGQHYVRETNPTVNWLRDRPALMVGLGASLDVGTWVILRRLDRRHHRLATGLYYGLTVYRGYLVARTVQSIAVADDPLPIWLRVN